ARRAPSGALGRAGVLSRMQPGEWRPCARIGSVRRTAMMLTKDIDTLRDRTAPIDMTAAGFRSAGHGLVDQIADWLETLPGGPVMRDESPADVRSALHAERGL